MPLIRNIVLIIFLLLAQEEKQKQKQKQMPPSLYQPDDLIKARLASQHALDRLKDKFPASVPEDDLFAYVLNAADRGPGVRHCLRVILSKDNEIKKEDNGKSYSYKPPIDVRSEQGLLQLFQRDADQRSLEVAKLKKGWPDCDTAIDKLESEHKLVVLRNKKDGTPRVIFEDDPSLHAPLDREFIDLWMTVPLPPKDDVIKFLVQSKRTPAGRVADNKVIAKVKSKQRKSRQSSKQTNKHMVGIFRDYSALRKGK